LRGTRRTIAAAAAFVLSLGILLPSIGSADESEPQPPHVVGELKRFPDDLQQVLGESQPLDTNGNNQNKLNGGIPTIDPASRTMVQIYEVRSGGIAVLTRDLDTFEPRSVVKIPELGEPLNDVPSTRRGIPGAIDGAGKRLFIWADLWRDPNAPALFQRGFVVVDLSRSASTAPKHYRFTPMPEPEAEAGTASSQISPFYGMTYVPSTKKVFVRLEKNDGQNFSKLDLLQLSVGASDPMAVTQDWSRYVRSCRSIDGNNGEQTSRWYPIVYSGGDKPKIVIPCSTSSSATIVEIPISDGGLPLNEEVFVGGGFAKQWVVDEPGGRIHAEIFSQLGPAVLTFDMKQHAFVGLTTIGEIQTQHAAPLGVDESTGRIYALGEDPNYGLTLIDGRLTPPPPGERYPEFAGFASTIPYAPILFDPPTRRSFVPDRFTSNLQNPPENADRGKFLILSDDPPLPPPPPEDPDAKTRDLPENEGVTTQRAYSASASGYGTRVLIPGGVRGLPAAPYASEQETTWPLKSPCWTADRQLILGRVDDTSIGSSLGRSARAIAAETDTGTKADLKAPSRCDEKTITDPIRGVPNFGQSLVDNAYIKADENGKEWPFRKTECDGVEVPKDEAKAESFPLSSFSSLADCSSANDEVAGSSLAEPLAPGGDVTVASSGITTHIYRDPERGIVTQVLAFARGINIGGVIKIDGVYALGETWASGRPESSNGIGAGSKYLRSVIGFSSPGFSCGHGPPEEPCGDAQEMTQLNKAFAGNFQINFPPYENGAAGGPKLYDGTDKGYQAAIQRESFDALNTEFSNGDTFREVPAIEIVRYNDGRGWKRQRQIFQFAGVLANSQYGILPVEGEATPDPSITPTPTQRPRNDPTPAPTDNSTDDGAAAPVSSEPPTSSAPRSDRFVTREEVLDQPETVGSTKVPEPVTPTLSSGGGGFPVLSQVASVWKMLFSSPRTAGLLAAVWGLFLLPFALAQRRYLLLQAKSSTGELR
jgi:hypothetical protein